MTTVWTEVDSAVSDPAQSDIPLGPAATATSMLGRVYAQLDNLPSQHPHYALITNYINESKDELLTLGLALGKEVLDQIPRLRNWRWWGQTVAGQAYLPLPERMLYLEAMGYTGDAVAYSTATSQLKPSYEITAGEDELLGLLSRSTTGYPTMFRRAGSRLEMWPVPTTAFVTTVVVQGTRMDKDLSAASDALLMSPRLQLLAIDLTVVIAMEKMGWEEAPERRAAFESKLARLISPGQKERTKRPGRTRVAGMPR